MLKAIAIDDEPIALDIIRQLAEKATLVQMEAYFINVFEAMHYLQENVVDLLFLDVQMPDMSGIEFLQSLPDPPMVIFTTAYSEHAVTGFDLDAVDFLLKPFSQARFLKACNKAYQKQQNKTGSSNTIFLKSGYDEVRVQLDEIHYVEGSGNYVTFVLADKKIVTRTTMKHTEARLQSQDFLRVHRSYIVAKKYVSKISRHFLYLDDKAIPIGEGYRDRIGGIK